MKFLSVEDAAKRVGKTTQTIRNWLAAPEPLPQLAAGLIREDDLLEYDRRMRSRRGRPRKTAEPSIGQFIADVLAELKRQDDKWGDQRTYPDGTGGLYWARLASDAKRVTDAAMKHGDVTWRDVLIEEVMEAIAEDDLERLSAELIQVAAVAIQWRLALARRAA